MESLANALQMQFESGEDRDWRRYVLGQNVEDGPALGSSDFAVLPGDRGTRMGVDADPEVAALAALADRLEDSGSNPARLESTLLSLFARRELLARDPGFDGYAQLALAAEGLTLARVRQELDAAERLVRREVREEPALRADSLPTGAELWEHLRAFFAPLLDDVELHLDRRVRVAGMCKVCGWPNDVRVAVRQTARGATPEKRVRTLAVLAHEAGHAVHFRLLAERGLDFLEFATTSAVEQETYADLCERLVFETDLADELELSTAARRLVQRQRRDDTRRLIGRARFELGAYAAAVDAPEALQSLWREELTRVGTPPPTDASWAEDGHGFYTDDPLRRCAYPSAYLRSHELLALMEQPLTAERVVRRLRTVTLLRQS